MLDERFALAPDPELARIAWERVRDAGVEPDSDEVIRLLGFSTAAGDFLVRHPDEAAAVADPSERDRGALDREVAADVERLGVVAGLRRYRRRAILRVAARDHAAFRSAATGGAALLVIVLLAFVLMEWFARRRSGPA